MTLLSSCGELADAKGINTETLPITTEEAASRAAAESEAASKAAAESEAASKAAAESEAQAAAESEAASRAAAESEAASKAAAESEAASKAAAESEAASKAAAESEAASKAAAESEAQAAAEAASRAAAESEAQAAAEAASRAAAENEAQAQAEAASKAAAESEAQAAAEANQAAINAANGEPWVNGRKVYLTFDDGPSYLTPQVLDILDHYGIKATFFVTYQTDPAIVPYYNEIVKRGHTIAIHTASHKYEQIYSSMDAFTADFNQVHSYVQSLTGVSCQLYRFPGGSVSGRNAAIRTQAEEWLAQSGMIYHDWNVITGDGGTVTRDQAFHNVVDNIVGRSHPVVLAHDGANKETTVEALPAIIETLQRWGFVFEKLTPDVEPIRQGINW